MTPLKFCSLLTVLREKLYYQQQRCLVVLNGDLLWSNTLIKTLLMEQKKSSKTDKLALQNKAIAYGEQFTVAPELIINNFHHHLGTENDLVFFADNAFHPDAFAALSGTIRAGGVMIWLCDNELLNDKSNFFIQRIWQRVCADKSAVVINEEDKIPPNIDGLFTEKPACALQSFFESDCLTQEQHLAVKAIESVANGHRKRPLVLTADRGRGKSSALAIAVANLMQSPRQVKAHNIVITAPHKDAVKVFFMQLARSCPQGSYIGDQFTYKTDNVEYIVQFVAVDVLVLEHPDANLLLIDEAAAIPIYLLTDIVEHYHRVVFSSTVHGYEGAGRGFAINFTQTLAQKCPQYSKLHINQPIRWRENDPLEQLVFKSFLLAPLSELFTEISSKEVNTGDVRQVTQKQLFENEALLQQVFGVLVTAHYQTSPSDLKFLLTNEQLVIFVYFARDNQTVLSVALTLKEGRATECDIKLALASKKRLKDQFLPQSLLIHCTIRSAFDYQYLRIVRIAVQPMLQGSGLGTELLTIIEAYAQQQLFDFIGTSFGMSQPLTKFWGRAGYHFARIGFTQDKASGEHSCLLLKPITAAANNLILTINRQFYQRFCYYLAEQFQQINPQLVERILSYAKPSDLPELTYDDINAVEDFINKVSLYDVCAYSLSVWLCHKLTETPGVNAELLISKVLQRRPGSELCRQYQLTGKKALNLALISQAEQLLNT
ncbi:GNAT family N-acetyltransferase [Thalassotalea piscium]|uniref:tRNA(Met) cytidine acetyltransferase TmcA n=1 Tax=Thalassotalea piscium TaxID=1230533 RepID=A0A7X0NGN3_9GAMM|nr:GNAT family N-acetyltransferase [Thalassotalea piscium]MBB6542946.1 tRNA(Met) cytidine acetyltransferase [Thalassotalea piscium]